MERKITDGFPEPTSSAYAFKNDGGSGRGTKKDILTQHTCYL